MFSADNNGRLEWEIGADKLNIDQKIWLQEYLSCTSAFDVNIVTRGLVTDEKIMGTILFKNIFGSKHVTIKKCRNIL